MTKGIRKQSTINHLAVNFPDKLPQGMAAKVEKWASDGATMRACARWLGMGDKTFRQYLDRFPDLKAAWDAGCDAEEKMLLDALKKQLDKSPVPAIFLLKARHGYREGEQTETINRVSITFDLPGAMPLKAYMKAQPSKVIEHKPDADAED